MQTREKVGMKRNELEEIDERTSRQADEEFQQEKKDLIAFYKVSCTSSSCNIQQRDAISLWNAVHAMQV